jgi:hypothetical protein
MVRGGCTAPSAQQIPLPSWAASWAWCTLWEGDGFAQECRPGPERIRRRRRRAHEEQGEDDLCHDDEQPRYFGAAKTLSVRCCSPSTVSCRVYTICTCTYTHIELYRTRERDRTTRLMSCSLVSYHESTYYTPSIAQAGGIHKYTKHTYILLTNLSVQLRDREESVRM